MSMQRELLNRLNLIWLNDYIVFDHDLDDKQQKQIYDLFDEVQLELAKPEPKPVAWMYEDSTGVCFENTGDIDHGWIPLYTSQPQYEPLSDDEITAMSRMFKINYFPPDGAILNFARAIEKAHDK